MYMRRKNVRRLGGVLCFLFVMMTIHAQYTVSGGQGTPLLAITEKPLQVYLVNGMENVSISYTSTSSSHQWYRYKTKALEREPVTCEQNGTTSVIRNIEDGYGYYVEEPGMNGWYVWIIDYSKYIFNPQSLTVKYGDCSSVRLTVSPAIASMSYHLPANGLTRNLTRQFDVSYQTLKWMEDSKQFVPETKQMTIEGATADNLLIQDKGSERNVPLCDTEFTLTGDQFARHFGLEKSITSDIYTAVAIDVHADTTLIADQVAEDGRMSAPVEVHFAAYANEPVASMFIWKIYRSADENGPENPLVRFPGEEVDYTFREFGKFTVELEVSDRSGVCTDNSVSYELDIMESGLEVPNAFSPGTTPGINDEFRVSYKSIVNYKCWIFNRWGVEMYHSTNPAEGWDGKKGGKYVPPGVYFYIIEAKGSDGYKHNKKGSINILRPKTIDDEIIEK